MSVDCRFSLKDTEAGRKAWAEGTIEGAVYAHLDADLSGPVVPGQTGRHPLPDPARFAQTLGEWGIGPDTQVVAFDDMGGPFAARLWWMLRWLGHDAVAVLDGGLPAYAASGHPLVPGAPNVSRTTFVPKPRTKEMIASIDDVLGAGLDPAVALLDARAPARFRGEVEPTDAIAGHIPGATNAPFADNLTAERHVRPTAELREHYAAVLDGRSPVDAICYCGSGVTACHDILAIVHTGQPAPRLYPGSWSEWIVDPQRPRQ